MPDSSHFSYRFTLWIVLAMVLGLFFGAILKILPISETVRTFLVVSVLQTGGNIFIRLITMLVVPVVFFSLICGSAVLGDLKAVGRMGVKTLLLYLSTTAIAVTLALSVASFFHIGDGMTLGNLSVQIQNKPVLFHQMLVDVFPKNPINALARGNMLQIIVFALLVGVALSSLKDRAKNVTVIVQELNDLFMRLILMVMKLAPLGVFCLLSVLGASVGLSAINNLAGYFFVVLFVLLLQLLFIYPAFISVFARLSPFVFLYKMRDAMLFAFSISSSNASIPIVLNTVEKKLGVKNTVASFIIPLGATINMDGTAIMQGTATIFIANAYHLQLGMAGYLTVIGMATVASIGAAGVPGVGMITLGMVLQQVGLPLQGVALIIGIDRLLDMARTAVNISGDAMVACVVGKSEKAIDGDIFNNNH